MSICEEDYLYKVDDILLLPGAAHCKLCQPDLLAIPVVEHLQLVHDLVHIPNIVMGGKVVNPAAKVLTGLKEWIKPVSVATSRSRTDQNLNRE